jgi:hypothetical protein
MWIQYKQSWVYSQPKIIIDPNQSRPTLKGDQSTHDAQSPTYSNNGLSQVHTIPRSTSTRAFVAGNTPTTLDAKFFANIPFRVVWLQTFVRRLVDKNAHLVNVRTRHVGKHLNRIGRLYAWMGHPLLQASGYRCDNLIQLFLSFFN